ncbi:MAG: hypothetical protein DWQ07_07215 [Chloroflexi bacterium]|nr:MAG: hypothetical protein DWQ07_07215 [Chloroflexota bacterium]MBL1195508.1 hypothetical protein [Chloroflexota bacterium]NOH12790.1 hypothetical protein [Chloroflexota bacterium]
MPETLETQDAPVFSYVLASADMRYIENGERDIYLRNDPELGLVFRGELAGCGPGCYVDLSQVFLEYAMSCEGCKEEGVGTEQAVRFGEHLAEVLLKITASDIADLPVTGKLSTTLKLVLDSMNATYVEEVKEGRLEYSLTCCPLSECGKSEGLGIGFEMAHLSFTALCKSLIKPLAPEWKLLQPSVSDTGTPIHKVVAAIS